MPFCNNLYFWYSVTLSFWDAFSGFTRINVQVSYVNLIWIPLRKFWTCRDVANYTYTCMSYRPRYMDRWSFVVFSASTTLISLKLSLDSTCMSILQFSASATACIIMQSARCFFQRHIRYISQPWCIYYAFYKSFRIVSKVLNISCSNFMVTTWITITNEILI